VAETKAESDGISAWLVKTSVQPGKPGVTRHFLHIPNPIDDIPTIQLSSDDSNVDEKPLFSNPYTNKRFFSFYLVIYLLFMYLLHLLFQAKYFLGFRLFQSKKFTIETR
jgi:hypothetical protein